MSKPGMVEAVARGLGGGLTMKQVAEETGVNLKTLKRSIHYGVLSDNERFRRLLDRFRQRNARKLNMRVQEAVEKLHRHKWDSMEGHEIARAIRDLAVSQKIMTDPDKINERAQNVTNINFLSIANSIARAKTELNRKLPIAQRMLNEEASMSDAEMPESLPPDDVPWPDEVNDGRNDNGGDETAGAAGADAMTGS